MNHSEGSKTIENILLDRAHLGVSESVVIPRKILVRAANELERLRNILRRRNIDFTAT